MITPCKTVSPTGRYEAVLPSLAGIPIGVRRPSEAATSIAVPAEISFRVSHLLAMSVQSEIDIFKSPGDGLGGTRNTASSYLLNSKVLTVTVSIHLRSALSTSYSIFPS